MKTNKSTKIFAVLFVLLAAVVTGCANSSSGDDEKKEKTYKVELGDLTLNDYMEYQTWRFDETRVTSYDILKAKRDELYSKTLEGTYQDKGKLSASDLKAFLMENGQEEEVASDAIMFANKCGNEITAVFTDKTYAKATWVYIEKE
jgi:hypothetical protein